MKSVLIAPNSFKECADSIEIANLIETELKNYFKDSLSYTLIPISDGGDGFRTVCERNLHLDTLSFEISYPFNEEKFYCKTAYDKQNGVIYIESAEVLGMKIVPREFRNPLSNSSKGMGELLLLIAQSVKTGKLNVNKVIIGIGGTATNDFGIGMMNRLGLNLRDAEGRVLQAVPDNFNSTARIERGTFDLPFSLEVVVDVQNQLTGVAGATMMFGKQKGADEASLQKLESGINNLLKLLDISGEELSGAGGGLAAGLNYFLNADVVMSSTFVLNDLRIRSEKSNFNFVITGEGSFDEQSELDKGAMIVIREFASKIPVFVICGIKSGDINIQGVDFIEMTSFFPSKEESIRNYRTGIAKACKEIFDVVGARKILL